MSILDKVKNMMSGSGGSKGSGISPSGKHKRQASEKVDRAAERGDDMTGGRFDDQIESGRDQIQGRMDDR